MLNAELIATCLKSAGFVKSVDEGCCAVNHMFLRYFPERSFNVWNRPVGDDKANYYIRRARKASTINVESFIKELS